MKRTTHQEFAVTPPDLRKTWLLPGLAMMAAGAGMVFAAREEPKILWLLPVLLLSFVVIAIRRRRVEIGVGELRYGCMRGSPGPCSTYCGRELTQPPDRAPTARMESAMKPFTSLACLLLAAIALLQLTRVVLGWDVVVNGVPIPLWASGFAAVVTGGLSALAWRESRH